MTNPKISIITLNVNDLYIPIKRQKLEDWIIKHDSTMCCLPETYLKHNNIGR